MTPKRELFDLGNKAQRAAWVHQNFITDDTDQIAADAGEVLNTYTVELAKKAHRFDSLKLPPEMARKMLLVKLPIGISRAIERRGTKRISGSFRFARRGLRQREVVPGREAAKGGGTDPKCLDITAIDKLWRRAAIPKN